MRKILFLLLFCSVFLTGCVNSKTEITFDNNGDAVIINEILVPQQIDTMSGHKFTEINDQDKSSKLQIEKISDGSRVGMKKTLENPNVILNDLNNLPSVFSSNSLNYKMVDIKNNLFYTVYSIDWSVDYTKDPETGEVMPVKALDFVNADLKINLPIKATFQNANNINESNYKYTYQWIFNPHKINSVKIIFSLWNWQNVIIALILIAITLGLILMPNSGFKVLTKITSMLIALIIIACTVNLKETTSYDKNADVDYYGQAKFRSEVEGECIDDYAVAQKDGKYGFVSKNNKFVVNPIYKNAQNTEGDYFFVCNDSDGNKCAYMNKKSKKLLTDFKYIGCGNSWRSEGFSEGLAMIVVGKSDNFKVGYINKSGEEVIKPKYIDGQSFKNGVAEVTTKDGNTIKIDKNGNVIK